MLHLFLTCLFAFHANAAVKTAVDDVKVIESLRGPHEVAVNQVRAMGGSAIEKLKQVSFDNKLPIKTRWRAFMVFTDVAGVQSLPQVKQALVSDTWFMRSAGLLAMQKIDRQGAKKWAFKILSRDPALMVRMKALEVLEDDSSPKVRQLFWEKIYSQDSSYRNQSLFIRKDIAKILVKDPKKMERDQWVKLLHEQDRDLQAIAGQALAKIFDNPERGAEVSFWRAKFPKTL